jgi:hypothetical protein
MVKQNINRRINEAIKTIKKAVGKQNAVMKSFLKILTWQ